MDEKSPGSWEPGSQRPDQKLAKYYDFAAKSLSGQAIYYDFVTEISQSPDILNGAPSGHRVFFSCMM